MSFEAILLASYGGPESFSDVEPFLARILAGKNVPATRRTAILERYALFDGISPLPSECRHFLELLHQTIENAGSSIRIYWGNLYASPSISEAFEKMERDGIQSVLVFASSAFGSAPSCRRYIEATSKALEERSSEFVAKLTLRHAPPCFETNDFQRTVADSLLDALAWDEMESALFSETNQPPSRLILFTAHSIPKADDESSQYQRQLLHACTSVLQCMLNAPGFSGLPRQTSMNQKPTIPNYPVGKLTLIAPPNEHQIPNVIRNALRARSLDAALTFQSRSGSPFVPWLEPDVCEFINEYRSQSPELESIIIAPIGFFFENMETIYDLDIEVRNLCMSHGLRYRRARCCGASRRLAEAVRQFALLNDDDFPVCSCPPNACDFSCRLHVDNKTF